MDQNWDMDFVYNGPIENQVSCTLGYLEPVAACNMINDQPFFYIEDSADEEDMMILEELFGEDEACLNDADFIESLRERLEAYDRSAESLSHIDIKPTSEVFDETFFVPSQKLTAEHLLKICDHSRTFKSYWSLLHRKGIEVVFDKTTPNACYDRNEKVIQLNPYLSMDKAAYVLIKNFRLAWQHAQGALMNPLRFQPEDAVLLNRLMAADQDVMAVAVAWELRLAGYKSLWGTLMAGSEYDLCCAYAMEAMTNFRSINSGLAARATFEKWFISGRCKLLDRTIIQHMLSHNADYVLKDEETSRLIAVDIISKMGHRPMGKNYLTPIASNIISDALYTDVRDRANANFLWFIQFEKKMNDTEQKLQKEGVLESSVVSCDPVLKDTSNGQSANIIRFPNKMFHHDSLNQHHDGMGASVYYIDHFRSL